MNPWAMWKLVGMEKICVKVLGKIFSEQARIDNGAAAKYRARPIRRLYIVRSADHSRIRDVLTTNITPVTRTSGRTNESRISNNTQHGRAPFIWPAWPVRSRKCDQEQQINTLSCRNCCWRFLRNCEIVKSECCNIAGNRIGKQERIIWMP
jgi:hypothetical protein